MTAPLLHKILSPAECYEVSALLEAKYLALRALPQPESESARVAREAAEAYHREVVAPVLAEQDGCELCLGSRVDVEVFRDQFGQVQVIVPCRLCRKVGHDEFMRLRAAALAIDPWDLDESELNHTAPLPREAPAFYGQDRGDFDPTDSKDDLQPFTRTTR